MKPKSNDQTEAQILRKFLQRREDCAVRIYTNLLLRPLANHKKAAKKAVLAANALFNELYAGQTPSDE